MSSESSSLAEIKRLARESIVRANCDMPCLTDTANHADLPPWVAALDSDVPQCFGRFRIERLLGMGGFGLVFLAHDPALNRAVALKIPRPEKFRNRDLKTKILAEARTAARLDHPGIIPVFESGELNGLWYIASGYCEGESLAERLHDPSRPRFAAREIAQIMRDICLAVQHAHARGVLHRDLKPSNVLLQTAVAEAQKSSAPQPKLTDFGLAIPLGERTEHKLDTAGTPSYIPPETLRTKDAVPTIAADVYGLGAILYEMLCGVPPFEAEDFEKTLAAVREFQLIRPRQRLATIDRDLEAIALKCLAAEPGERYASAEELAAEFERFLRGEPVTSRPLPWPQRIVKYGRRRPLVAGLLLALALTMLAGISGMLSMWYRAELQLVETTKQRDLARVRTKETQDMALHMFWLMDEAIFWNQYHSPRWRQQLQESSQYSDAILRREATDQAALPMQAFALTYQARIQIQQGNASDVVKLLQQSLQLWQQILAADPEQKTNCQAAANALFHYGDYLALSKEESFQKLYQQTQPLFGVLDLETRIGQLILAEYLELLGDKSYAYQQRGYREPAKRYVQEQRRVLNLVEPRLQQTTAHQLQKFAANRQYADLLIASEDFAQAEKILVQDLERCEELLAKGRSTPEYLSVYGRVWELSVQLKKSLPLEELIDLLQVELERVTEANIPDAALIMRLTLAEYSTRQAMNRSRKLPLEQKEKLLRAAITEYESVAEYLTLGKFPLAAERHYARACLELGKILAVKDQKPALAMPYLQRSLELYKHYVPQPLSEEDLVRQWAANIHTSQVLNWLGEAQLSKKHYALARRLWLAIPNANERMRAEHNITWEAYLRLRHQYFNDPSAADHIILD